MGNLLKIVLLAGAMWGGQPISDGQFVFSERVYAGSPVDFTKYSWFATLISEYGNGVGSRLCGGFLASPRFLITAAHCVLYQDPTDPRLITSADAVYLYFHQTIGGLRMPLPARMAVRGYVSPEYGGASGIAWYQGDLAILELESAVIGIAPVQIAFDRAWWETLTRAQPVRTVGYGLTEFSDTPSTVLLSVDMERVPNSICTSGTGMHWSPDIVYDDLCVGSSEFYINAAGKKIFEDSCRGDSGGPLFQDRPMAGLSSPGYLASNGGDFTWPPTVDAVVFGVVSRGFWPCGTGILPGIYSGLYRFDDFIASRIPRPAAESGIVWTTRDIPLANPSDGDIFNSEYIPPSQPGKTSAAAPLRADVTHAVVLGFLLAARFTS